TAPEGAAPDPFRGFTLRAGTLRIPRKRAGQEVGTIPRWKRHDQRPSPPRPARRFPGARHGPRGGDHLAETGRGPRSGPGADGRADDAGDRGPGSDTVTDGARDRK